MPAALLVMLRSFALICGGHRAVALENLALRQQLAVFKRTIPCPPLRPRDRLFWVLLAHAWRNWRSALIVVRPETVVCWHRHWLRRRWTRRSTSGRRGRPRTATAIRTLVDQMGAANRLWGAPRIHGELSKLGIDGATSHRGLSERHRAAVALAGSRCHLRERVPAPCRRHGHYGGHHQPLKSMAEPVRGETHRIHSARVSGPRDRPRRAAPWGNIRRFASEAGDIAQAKPARAHQCVRPGP